MERVECVVVGAGVVGLAVARALALAGREVLVLERNPRIGEETSSRSSEVIHAGMYYASGSHKARLCVAGRRRLYAYCASRGVPHRRLGKLIVATDAAQQATLDRILAQGAANGVEGLSLLAAAEVAALVCEVDPGETSGASSRERVRSPRVPRWRAELSEIIAEKASAPRSRARR